jgi:hypothetical protein
LRQEAQVVRVGEMMKIKILTPYILFLSLIFCTSGCVYLTHLDETLLLKSLQDNQNEMQSELGREENLFNKLEADIDNGRLAKAMPKNKIFQLYGEPSLCRQATRQSGIQETCIYRKPGGLSTSIILLNFDNQDKLSFWQIQNPDK